MNQVAQGGVTVITISFERMRALQVLLEGLLEQDLGGLPFEFILCSNSHRYPLKKSLFSGIGRALRKFPDVKIVNSSHNWPAGTRYALAALAKYNTILFLDDDVILKNRNFVAYMFAEHKKRKPVDILSCWTRLWSECHEDYGMEVSLTFKQNVINELTRCDVVGTGLLMFDKRILTPAVLNMVIHPPYPMAYDMGFSMIASLECGSESYYLPSHRMLDFHEERRKSSLMAKKNNDFVDTNILLKTLWRRGYIPAVQRLSPEEYQDSPEKKAVELLQPVRFNW